VELPTNIREALINKEKFDVSGWNRVIEIANCEDAELSDRQLCAKVLWEKAESAKAHIQKQCTTYHDLYLNLAHKEAQQIDKNKMHGMLENAIEYVL